MREIKFRWFDEKRQKMVFDFSEECDDLLNYFFWQKDDNTISVMTEGYGRECPPMQYTGLKDKNGVEIYEGDIVQFSVKGGRCGKGEVKMFPELGIIGVAANFRFGYNKADASMPVGSSGSSTPYKPYTWKSYKSIEVIGNIHENPELLPCTQS